MVLAAAAVLEAVVAIDIEFDPVDVAIIDSFVVVAYLTTDLVRLRLLASHGENDTNQWQLYCIYFQICMESDWLVILVNIPFTVHLVLHQNFSRLLDFRFSFESRLSLIAASLSVAEIVEG